MNRKEEGEKEEEYSAESFDDILETVGTKGWFNIIIIIACSLTTLFAGLQVVPVNFLAITPDYWCQVDELVEANWTAEQIRDFASPNNESCEYYNYDYSVAAAYGYDAVMENPSLVPGDNTTITCSKRFFDDGYHTIVTEWDLVCENLWISTTAVSATQIGTLIGSLAFGYILDRFGRRFGMVLGSISFIPFGLALAGSVNPTMFILLRTAVTASGMGIYLAGFVLTMELCTPAQRTLGSSYFVLPWALAYMISAPIAFYVPNWQYLQIALTLPSVLLIVNICMVPESPRWLCFRGRYNEALTVLKKFASRNNKPLPPDHEILACLQKVAPPNDDKSEEPFDLKIWIKRWIVPQLVWMTPVVFFCWFSVAMVYYGVSLGASTFGINEYEYIFFGGILEIASYLAIWPGISILGRRNCLIFAFIVGAASIFGIMARQLKEVEGDDVWLLIFSYTGKFMITPTFHLLYVVTGELYTTCTRSLMIGEASVIARVGSALSPFIYTFLGEVQTWAPAALFASFSLASGLLSISLPETKNIVLDNCEEDDTNNTSVETGQSVRANIGTDNGESMKDASIKSPPTSLQSH